MKRLQIIAVSAIMIVAAACESSRTATTSYTASDDYSTSNMAMVDAPTNAVTLFSGSNPGATNVTWYTYTDRAGVPVDWELTGWQPMTDRDYIVSYNLNNNKYYGWYDANGNWVGSTYVVTDYTTMPSPISSTIQSRYAGYNITNARTVYWKDRAAYQVTMNDGTTKRKILVDGNGNIIKEKSMSMR